MGSEEERQSAKPLYNSLYMAFVEDRADPKGLSRVRIRIPGMLDKKPFTWALPLGMSGGGAKQRGRFQPAEVGSMVAVFFYMGDINQPFWMYAHWGEGEVPTNAAVAGDDEGNYPNETKAWLIEIDDRTPEVLTVTNKATGDKIIFEGTIRKLTATMKDAILEIDGISDKIKMEAINIELGKVAGGFPALRRLIDERVIPLLNGHKHLGNLGLPTSNMQVATPSTILVVGEATQGVSTTRTTGN